MGERAEDEARLGQRRIIGGDELHVTPRDAHALPPPVVGGGEAKLEPGMTGDEGAELSAGITAGSEDAHRDFIHV